MDFYNLFSDIEEGLVRNPFAAKTSDGKWIEGTTSIEFLNKHFSQCTTAEEMINATESEGLKLFFAWLRDEKGVLN